MVDLKIKDLVFPVVGGEVKYEGENGLNFQINQVYGTAFSIGDKTFLTAGHVVESAAENSYMGLGYIEGKSYKTIKIDDYKINNGLDLAVLKAGIINESAINIAYVDPYIAAKITTVGYPYALNVDLKVINYRAFCGNIVAERTYEKFKSNPRIFELSFPCPRGLSGSPVFVDDPVRFVGMVIGNIITEMVVYSEKEVINEKKETVYEKTESMHLGVALKADELFDAEFDLIGGKIGDHCSEYFKNHKK